MSYDLHITREPDEPDDSGDESNHIGLHEWLSLVDSDPELRILGVAECRSPSGEILRYENEGLAIWTGLSGDGLDDAGPWFDFRRGRIVVANPDDETIAKMCSVANVLGARVRGDGGEYYPRVYESTPDASHPTDSSQTRPWWKNIFGS